MFNTDRLRTLPTRFSVGPAVDFATDRTGHRIRRTELIITFRANRRMLGTSCRSTGRTLDSVVRTETLVAFWARIGVLGTQIISTRPTGSCVLFTELTVTDGTRRDVILARPTSTVRAAR